MSQILHASSHVGLKNERVVFLGTKIKNSLISSSDYREYEDISWLLTTQSWLKSSTFPAAWQGTVRYHVVVQDLDYAVEEPVVVVVI